MRAVKGGVIQPSTPSNGGASGPALELDSSKVGRSRLGRKGLDGSVEEGATKPVKFQEVIDALEPWTEIYLVRDLSLFAGMHLSPGEEYDRVITIRMVGK